MYWPEQDGEGGQNTDKCLFFVFFTTVLSQWDFFHGKFKLPSLEKASYNRVTLPNLGCMLDVLVFPPNSDNGLWDL